MYEVEVKVRADHDVVRPRLDSIGATHAGTVTQVDTYYDAPHRSFVETDEALRVRLEREEAVETRNAGDPAEDEVVLTYKGPLVATGSKTRLEHETSVADRGAMIDILVALGFEPVETVEKRREQYRIGDCRISLDAVAGLGEYVEVERTATEDELERASERVAAILSSINLDTATQLRTSYLELLLEANARTDRSG